MNEPWTVKEARSLLDAATPGQEWSAASYVAAAQLPDALRWALDAIEHRDRCGDAHLAGIAARLDDQPVSANPHQSGTDEANVWHIGWLEQHSEIRSDAEIDRLSAALAEAQVALDICKRTHGGTQ